MVTDNTPEQKTPFLRLITTQAQSLATPGSDQNTGRETIFISADEQ